jgi:hypothetical protein
MRLLWLSVLMSGWALAQTVEGTVIDASTGRGLPEVGIELRPTFEATNNQTDTDDQGHFVIEGLKPGTYRFVYRSDNYWSSDPAYPTTFQVGGAAATVRLEGRMLPRPRISGRVLDAKGDPVARARITAIGPSGSSINTGEDGGFELAVIPGAYLLAVAPPADLKPPYPEPDTGHPLVWRRTFYPGVARIDEAVKIRAALGNRISGLEIKLLPVPTRCVRGVLLYPDGHPAPNVPLTLGQTVRFPEYHAKTNGDGEFEFAGVIDGEWLVVAELANETTKWKAIESVEIAGHDRAALKVRLQAPFQVRGRVVFEGAEQISDLSPAPDWSWLTLLPVPSHGGAGPGMLNSDLNPELLFDRPHHRIEDLYGIQGVGPPKAEWSLLYIGRRQSHRSRCRREFHR